jgi:hypothetical protein
MESGRRRGDQELRGSDEVIGLKWIVESSSRAVPCRTTAHLREEVARFLPFGTLRAKPADSGRSLLLGLGEVFFRVGLAHGV